MKKIALEDIATVFVTDFVKMFKEYLQGSTSWPNRAWARNIPFLKMNYVRRRELIDKLLSSPNYFGDKKWF